MTALMQFKKGDEVPVWLLGGKDRDKCEVTFSCDVTVSHSDYGWYHVRYSGPEVAFVDPHEPGAHVELRGGGSGVCWECAPSVEDFRFNVLHDHKL